MKVFVSFAAVMALSVLAACFFWPFLRIAFGRLRRQGVLFALIGAGFLVSMAEKPGPGGTIYTVKFDMNGGKPSVTPEAADLEVGVPESTVMLAALANEDRENCWTFLGWSTNRAATVAEYAGGAAYRDATAAPHQTNTLYAIWEERIDWTCHHEPEEGYDAGGHRLRYLYKGDYAILKYIEFNEGASGTLAIPAALGGRPVERVETSWSDDSHRANLKSLLIPASVRVVHSHAFANCKDLTNVTFEAGSQLKEIAQNAFVRCAALPRIALPESLTRLGACAFDGCTALTDVILPSNYVGDTASGVFSSCPIGKLVIPAACVGFGSSALNRTEALRFLGDRPTWDVYRANQGAATLFEFPATNATWDAGKIPWCESVPHKGFVGPVAAMGAEKCCFWTNAENTVAFAYAEDALAAEVDVPASVTWGGVTWTVTGFEKNAFANQATTAIRYPASWTERMWGVDPATLAEGLVSARPSGDFCTVTFNGGTGSTGTMADYHVPTGYATHLPSNTLARTGYTFVKWRKLSAPTAAYLDGAAFTGAAAGTTVALDAFWECVGNYTIHFDGNSAWAVDVPADMKQPVGTTPAIPADPSREGWAFGGWTNAVNDHVYRAGDAFDEGCAANTTFTLYAKWSATTDSNLTYADGDGTVWTYDRTGDSVTIKKVVPGADVETLELPESIKGSTLVQKASGYNLPEKFGGLWWNYEELANNEAKLTSVILSGPAGLVMPSEIAGRTVIAFATVGQSLVTNRNFITSVEIPGTVTVVPQDAFWNCRDLTDIVLHEGTVSIGSDAFGYTALAAPIDFPDSLTNVHPGAFEYVDSVPYDEDGFMYADTGKTYLLRAREDVAFAPEGVKTLAVQAFLRTECAKVTVPESVEVYGGDLFDCSDALREVVFMSSAALPYNSMFDRTLTVTNVTLYGGEQVVGSFADSPSRITTVGFLTTPPAWNVTDKFPYATTVCYYANYAADWADYKTAHPLYAYVELAPECVEATVGQNLELDLEEDLGVEIDADYAAGDKVTVKIEGLAKGLKLVATPIKVIVGKKTVISGCVYTIAGIPTEAVDFATQPMFARVTTTYKDKAKGKVETLTPLKLAIRAATVETFPETFLSSNYVVDVRTLWPDADASWQLSGLPPGLKYNASAKPSVTVKKTKVGKRTVTTAVTNALPFEVYGTPTQAGTFALTFTQTKKSGKKTTTLGFRKATLTVWPEADEAGYRFVDQACVALSEEGHPAESSATAASGLPTGVRFAASSHAFTGKPTRAGVSAVTLTKPNPSNGKKKVVVDRFLWKVTEGENGGFLGSIDWTVRDSTVTVMQGVIQTNWHVVVSSAAKVTATGLPTGLTLAQNKATKAWTLTGTPTKTGNFVVTFKTVLNSVTKTERIAMVVEANAYAGEYYGVRDDWEDDDVSWTAYVSVAAGGSVKLVLTEGTTNSNAKGVVQSQVSKTTVTAKNLDGDGRSVSFTLPGDRKIAGAKERACKIDFQTQCLYVDGEFLAWLAPRQKFDFEVPQVATMVAEEFVEGESGNSTNAFACLTATYNQSKGLVGIQGKLKDGTAVKATTYALSRGCVAPFLVTDKSKNSVSFELRYDYLRVADVKTFSCMIATVCVNGKVLRVGEGNSHPSWDGFDADEAKLLKATKFSAMTAATNLLVLVDATGASRQETLVLPIPPKSLATKLTAQGLVTFKNLRDADGRIWTCELLPVGEMLDGDTPFRGIATGTKKGEATLRRSVRTE